MMKRTWMGVVLALSAFGLGCGHPQFRKTGEFGPSHTPILQAQFKLSNIYLIRGEKPVLVDAGAPGDWDDLLCALREQGLEPKDIAWVVITHGHADHSALAQALQKSGAKIVLGKGDVPLAAQGRNDELKPTNLTARLIKSSIDLPYDPYKPDIALASTLSLASWGYPTARIEALPGHTAGSLVLFLDERQVIAGDMMLGGFLGGALFSSSAGEHYYQADFEKNHENVRKLLDHGVEAFYLGHGGPVYRESVLKWLGPIRP